MQVIKTVLVGSFVAAASPLFAADATPSALTAEQQAEVRALVKEVLADADSRSSLANGATAGIDNDGKVFLRSEDDKFGMNIGGLVQLRYDYHNESGAGAGNREGFDLRRVNLDIKGHLGGDQRVDYRLLLGTQLPGAGSSQEVGVEEAYLQHEVVDGLTVRAGKFVLPYSREQLIGHGSQVAVDRSAVNSYFGLARAEGVQVQWTDGQNVVLRGAVSDGGNSESTFGLTDAVNFAASGRADFLLAGGDQVSMSDFNDSFALRDGSGKQGVLLGFAGYYEDAKAVLVGPNALESSYGATVDATVKIGNLAFYGAGFITRRNVDNVQDVVTPWGALGQVDVAVANNLDVFGQYQLITDDSTTGSGAEVFQAFTAGANYHLNSHVRLTGDATYVYQGQPLAGSVTPGNPGINTTSNTGLIGGTEGEIVVRLQVQVKF